MTVRRVALAAALALLVVGVLVLLADREEEIRLLDGTKP